MRTEGIMTTKATKLEEIIQTCGYYPLSTDDLAKFYVNTDDARGVNLLQELKTVFSLIPGLYPQILCLGHRGAGKSTMFFQLTKELENNYDIVSFSIQDSFDMEKITFTDLLCLIYKTLLEKYKDELEDQGALQQIYDLWYSTQAEEMVERRKSDLSVKAEAEGGLVTKVLKLVAQVTSSLNFSSESRTILTRCIQRHIVDYIDSLNHLMVALEESIPKPILMIIDDLDKISMTSTKDIFIEHSMYLKKIRLRLVLTAPIWLKYMPEYVSYSVNYTRIVRYPMIAVVNSEYDVSPKGYQALKQIALARIDEALVSGKALELAIFMSGGQIRDLLMLLSNAALYCLSYGTSNIIDEIAVRKAFQNLQESFEDRLRTADAELLQKIIQSPQKLLDISPDQLYDLMYSGVILEYNGMQWRGVHPAAMACLVKSGLMSEDEFRKYVKFDL